MRNFVLKASLLSVSLALLSAAYADGDSTIPAQSSGFGIALTGLYLQPGASNLDYAVNTHPAPPASAPTWEQELVDPKYKGAFDLNLNYVMQDQVDQILLLVDGFLFDLVKLTLIPVQVEADEADVALVKLQNPHGLIFGCTRLFLNNHNLRLL